MSRKNREIGPAFLSVSNDLFCPRVPELSAATAFEAEPDKVQCDNRAGIELLRAQMIPLYQVGLHQE